MKRFDSTTAPVHSNWIKKAMTAVKNQLKIRLFFWKNLLLIGEAPPKKNIGRVTP
jgi:hypothetical protein